VPGGALFKTPPWHLQLFTAPIKLGDSNPSRLRQDFPAQRRMCYAGPALTPCPENLSRPHPLTQDP